ncbi:spermidine synthase, partial [Leucobacter sp. M11]|uniref:spermidine synthase n=1 Tax=Leucobacter sp. M11 TaxID=2993565 RepID=UPI002D804443
MSQKTVTLGVSGLSAHVQPDRFVPGAFELIVDGTPQSHVLLDDPSELFYEYVRRIGHVIDLVAPAGAPITAVHLGGGALTLPRYVEATRPGSSQQVAELESELVALVREELPLPKRARIRVRHGDARAILEKLPAGLNGVTDAVIVDIFSGAQTPAHVTSREFYALVPRLLAPGGVLAVNAADGPGLPFVRSQLATLRTIFPFVGALAEAQVLKGRRFGNVILVAGAEDRVSEWMPRLLAGGPHPARMLIGAELTRFIADAPVVTDDTATPSPAPSSSLFT